MPTLILYENPLNSPSGLSFQPDADNGDMIRVAQFEQYLLDQGVEVKRASLTTNPRAFLDNPQVMQYISVNEDSLPLAYVDGERVLEGRYPSDQELAQWFGLPELAKGAPQLTEEQIDYLRREAQAWGDCPPSDCSSCAVGC